MNKIKETPPKEVQETLTFKPQLRSSKITTTVQNGMVSLVDTAEDHQKKADIHAVEEKIEVQTHKSSPITDELLAKRILKVFKSAYWIPDQNLKIKVDAGWVTLKGSVRWNFQKLSAQNLVAQLTGVRGISNHIQTRSESENERQKKVIEKAIKSNAALQNNLIEVQVNGHEVTLSGMTNSIFEKEEAERITWKIPRVWIVINDLGVDSF